MQMQRLEPRNCIAAAVVAYSAWNGYALLVQVRCRSDWSEGCRW